MSPMPVAANTFHGPGLTPVEILAEVKKALHIDSHVLVLQEDFWFIRHALSCRESGGHCAIAQRLQTTDWDRLRVTHPDGSYKLTWVTTAGYEQAVRLDQVVPGWDPMMTRLKELGVW